MASTTFAQGVAKLTASMAVLETTRKSANQNTYNFVGQAQAYETTAQADGNQATQASNGILQLRASYEGMLASSVNQLSPLLDLIAKSPQVNSKAGTDNAKIDDVTKYMQVNGERFQSRLWLSGAVTPGSPYAGTPLWLRVTTDQYGLPLEARFAETVNLLCDQDQNGGLGNLGACPFKGREHWTLSGSPFRGVVEKTLSGRGSGMAAGINNANGDASLLANTSFALFGNIATAPSNLPNWNTVGLAASPNFQGDGSDAVIDQVNFYQASQNEGTTPAALTMKVSMALTQQFQGVGTNNIQLTTAQPYHSSIMYNASVLGASGLLSVSAGSKSNSVVVNGAACTAAAGTSGSVTAGTHSYVYTLVVSGVESCYSAKSNVITASGSTIVNLTGIAVGPAGTTARKIYRTVAGDAGNYLLLATISDNTTTVYADNTADGSLGAAVTTSSGAGWLMLMLPSASSTNADLWLRNFDQPNAAFTITWTKASGSLNIDRGLFVPFYGIAAGPQGSTSSIAPSSYLLGIAGNQAVTNSADTRQTLLNDAASFTDSENGAIVSFWFETTWRRSPPTSPPSPVAGNSSATAITATLSATAGVVTTGTHLYAVSYLDETGNESGLSAASGSVSADGSHKVDLTTIPKFTGTGITQRWVYRTKAGTSTPYFRVTLLADNTTTTFSDNLADGSLGAAYAGVAVTRADPAA